MDDRQLTLLPPVVKSRPAGPAGGSHTFSPSAGGRVEPLPPVSVPRPIAIAQQIYLKLRPHYPDRASTLAAVVEVLTQQRSDLPAEAPPGDVRVITHMAREYQWEQDWLRGQIKAELDDEPTSPLSRLRELKDILADVHSALSKHAQMVGSAKAVGAADAETLRKLISSYQDTLAQLTEIDAQARKSLYESTNTPGFQRHVDEITAALLERYADLGPQYQLMCRSLAVVSAQIEQRVASDRQVPTEELAKLHELQTKLTAQMQRHTESTKSESFTQERSQIVVRVMEIVYNRLASQPELARDVVVAVMNQVGGDPAALPSESEVA